MLAGVLLLSITCAAMLHYRIHYTGSERYAFMAWNLTLAWVPASAALAATVLARSRARALRALSLPFAAVWLAFLPNAPYMATDLIHLEPRPQIPFWYDQAMMVAFAVTGIALGLFSMLLMHEVVEREGGRVLGWAFASAAAVLAAFGIYLGRFERLNSWELFSRPAGVLEEAGGYLANPVHLSHAAGWTLTFSAFLIACYICLSGIAGEASRLLAERARSRR
jgi:uncharacterized membrane protein